MPHADETERAGTSPAPTSSAVNSCLDVKSGRQNPDFRLKILDERMMRRALELAAGGARAVSRVLWSAA